MGSITLGGRTFDLRPLKVKHLNEYLPRWAAAGDGLSGGMLDLMDEVLFVALVQNGEPITLEWLRELDGSEKSTIAMAAKKLIDEAGVKKASNPGEASGPSSS